MPPWYIDRNVGVQGFKYDRSLSDAEIATLAAWVDGGAPRGNPADMPPPVEFADRDQWHIGEPDWIVPLPDSRSDCSRAAWQRYRSSSTSSSRLEDQLQAVAPQFPPGPVCGRWRYGHGLPRVRVLIRQPSAVLTKVSSKYPCPATTGGRDVTLIVEK